MDESNKEPNITEGKNGIYEIGFLLVPTIAEENVSSEFQSIKSVVEKHGGALIGEEFPKLQPLAYKMAISVESKKSKFDQGYFGWVKFETVAENIVKIRTELKANLHVIRFILVSTIRENTLASQKISLHLTSEEDKKKAPEATPVSQEELDKTIDNLVVQ